MLLHRVAFDIIGKSQQRDERPRKFPHTFLSAAESILHSVCYATCHRVHNSPRNPKTNPFDVTSNFLFIVIYLLCDPQNFDLHLID